MTITLSQKKLLIFGAGRIGRSFIAQLFHESGYFIIFVDANPELVEMLNRKGRYRILVKSEHTQIHTISNYSALHTKDTDLINSAIADCDLCAVSVGKNALVPVAKMIANGLRERFRKKPEYPLDIILAENMRNAADYLKQQLHAFAGNDLPLMDYTGLIETSIGKMVPIIAKEDLRKDPLQIFAEPYNTLILDREAFRNRIPQVKGLAAKKNIKAWVDRKLFIHNLGHAALAYRAWLYNKDWKYTWEALQDNKLRTEIAEVMKESAHVLMHMHPSEFNPFEMEAHIHDLLERFGNKSLGDTLYRVGCDLPRKLGPEDRLVPVIRYAFRNQLPYRRVLTVLCSAIFFDARDENGERHPADADFLQKFNRNVKDILIQHCSFDLSTEFTIVEDSINLTKSIMNNDQGRDHSENTE